MLPWNHLRPETSGLPIWMDAIEQSQLLGIFHAVEPRRVLEWGAGGSTRFLLEHGRAIETYVSIEHDRAWYEKVQKLVLDPRLSLHHVAPDVPPPAVHRAHPAMRRWMIDAELDASMFASYVRRGAELGAALGAPLDFVLVDGRARTFCVAAGYALLRPGGVLVVHDAQRTVYHPALAASGAPVFLEPWRQGQIALVRKPDDGA